jgi:restriction endonuclease S subunit
MSKLQRYSSYKESGVEWLGEIPEHWEVQKLKFNSKIETGNSISDSKKNSYENIEVESYPYIATKDINYEYSTIDYDNGLRIPTIEKKFKITNPNTTLICIEGGSAGKKIAFNTQKVCYVNKLASIQNQTNASPKFLYYLTKSHMFKNQFQLSMNGLIGGVSTLIMKNFELVFPPKPEQTTIASYLDTKAAQIDQAICQKEQLIELLKERRQIVINDAVTKGVNPKAPMKESGVEWIGEIPEHWEVKKLKYIVQNKTTKSTENNFKIALENIESRTTKYIETKDIVFSEAGINFKKGDVLFGKLRPYLAKVYLAEKDGLCVSEFLVLEAKKMDNLFLKFLLVSDLFITHVNSSTYGTKMPRASWNFIGNSLIPIPLKDEQFQIVTYIEEQTAKIDAAIELQQKYIAKLKEYKATLIDSVVTGKVRVA